MKTDGDCYLKRMSSSHYSSLRQCANDLAGQGKLRIIESEVSPHLDIAEIQRRVYANQGPALLFTRVQGCAFPVLANLFGTRERAHYIFRDTLETVQKTVRLKADPTAALKKPWDFLDLPSAALHALPKRVESGPVLQAQTQISQLPQLVSWPKDGGAFITLPQVYTEHPQYPGLRQSNLGMYRIQLSGGQYTPEKQIGLHYQLHRGIGVHHHAAAAQGEKLHVSIFVGGPPSHTLAAVMPLPEGLPEVYFAGLLGGRRFRYAEKNGYKISAEADFCIVGTIDPQTVLPEGPFGDHLGYYSLTHDFPVLQVEAVYHRRDAIWPFTSVGRPPQEDSVFAELIHAISAPAIPQELPGVKAVHAVEAAGVHPLLLALGSERYIPYQKNQPQELLTQAHAILGFGQLSLAKYLWIAAQEDEPSLSVRDVLNFFKHMLERVDWETDLHFETQTTMDTLDYSGSGLNAGSKVVVAAVGEKKRQLGNDLSGVFSMLPDGFSHPHLAMPGVVVLQAPKYTEKANAEKQIAYLCEVVESGSLASGEKSRENFPLWILADDSEFTAKSLHNWLWITFTRSNPAADIHGINAFTIDKHWGCRGPLIIDARIKPHHAPVLESDVEVIKRVEALGVRGGCLEGLV